MIEMNFSDWKWERSGRFCQGKLAIVFAAPWNLKDLPIYSLFQVDPWKYFAVVKIGENTDRTDASPRSVPYALCYAVSDENPERTPLTQSPKQKIHSK